MIRPKLQALRKNTDVKQDFLYFKRNVRDFPDYVHSKEPFQGRLAERLSRTNEVQKRNAQSKKLFLQRILTTNTPEERATLNKIIACVKYMHRQAIDFRVLNKMLLTIQRDYF